MSEHELTRECVAAMIGHELLAPEATRDEAYSTVAEAAELGVYAVCLSPSMLPIDTGSLRLAVVAGFPSGQHHSLVKAAEARMAVEQGANEIDMVIDIGAAIGGLYGEVFADVLTVAQAIVGENILLKVIVESAVLLRDAGPNTLQRVCEHAVAAGANMVKTSTGFHSAGGASVEAVRLIADTVGKDTGIEASGSICDAVFATELIAAGATRLGLSQSKAVLDGFPSAVFA